ncbi:hypothetical protein BACCAP_03820 [Pseudoflavonifractor capillosus ATCC 29799]|uniref:Uncharacterized protein n=1 Tax=Pseudoflavonifractor capillosus ATCC 29799 TaxID=411467 RepID=A6P015_9FIRM|nr:hypothetical protein BACCAP_03820 [Pseudoflavonifractor capillosus ATCC 29799]
MRFLAGSRSVLFPIVGGRAANTTIMKKKNNSLIQGDFTND